VNVTCRGAESERDAAVKEAAVRGVDFLRRSQLDSGEFRSFMSPDLQMATGCVPDSSPFPTALIVYCLGFASGPSVQGLIGRALDFLKREMEWPGVWRYWTREHPRHNQIPPDLDDIACASDVLRRHGVRVRNRGLLTANRNRDGLFYTWLIPRGGFRVHPLYWLAAVREALKPAYLDTFFGQNESDRDDIDCVVNANVLLYLGENRRTRPVIDYLIRVVRERREACCDKWHLNPFTFYYMVSRNYQHGIKALAVVNRDILARIVASAAPNGACGAPLETAMAICAMLNLDARPPQLDAAVGYLLATQSPSGDWPRSVMYYGGPQKAFGWGSEEMTTAFCVEALERYRLLER